MHEDEDEEYEEDKDEDEDGIIVTLQDYGVMVLFWGSLWWDWAICMYRVGPDYIGIYPIITAELC